MGKTFQPNPIIRNKLSDFQLDQRQDKEKNGTGGFITAVITNYSTRRCFPFRKEVVVISLN